MYVAIIINMCMIERNYFVLQSTGHECSSKISRRLSSVEFVFLGYVMLILLSGVKIIIFTENEVSIKTVYLLIFPSWEWSCISNSIDIMVRKLSAWDTLVLEGKIPLTTIHLPRGEAVITGDLNFDVNF